MKKLYTFLFIILLSYTGFSQNYTTTNLVTGLSNPVAFDIAPDGRFFLTQKGGSSGMATNAYIRVFSPTGTDLGIFYDLSDSVNADFERGLLGIALDPDFTNNHYVYAYFNRNVSNDERIIVVRFTESNNTGSNPLVILDIDVSNNIPGNHVGGNIHFGPNEPDMLYIAIGDLGTSQSDPVQNHAPKLVNPFGKILRIHKNGSIPTDNPFYDDGDVSTGNDDRIWSYGQRNPFDFCFSPLNGTLYSSENGWYTWDEVNLIEKGGNYGWPYCEGNHLNSSTTNLCTNPAYINPLETWGTPLPAVTGITYYSGSVMPEFDNHLLVADNASGKIYDLTLGNAPAYDTVISRTEWIDLTNTGGLTTIRQGTDGCIYALKGGYTNTGILYRVCPENLDIPTFDLPVEISLRPNPLQANSFLNVTLKKPAQLQIHISDISGKMLFEKNAGFYTGEYYSLNVGELADSFSPGIYFCDVIVDGTRAGTIKLVK